MCESVVKIDRCIECGQLVTLCREEREPVRCLRCRPKPGMVRVRIECTVSKIYECTIHVPKDEYTEVIADPAPTCRRSEIIAGWLELRKAEDVDVDLWELREEGA